MTKNQRLVLIVCILASFVAFLDGFVVNVALPAISRELGGGLSSQQWVVDGYLITLGALILLAGSISDLFGRKRVLNLGLIGFGLTSLLCAIAPNNTFLIASRMLQGAAGALLVPSSLALIMSTFSGKAQGKAVGSWTAWTGISAVIGPLVGGILVDSASWRWIFGINVLPILATLLLLRFIDQPEPLRTGVKVDTLGAVLCTIGLGMPVYALIEQPRYGWGNAAVFLPFVLGLCILALFMMWERRNPRAMLPLSVFNVRNFSVGNVATSAIYGGLAIATFTITIFLQQVGGYSALAAGAAFLPVTVVMFALSSRFGVLSGKYGPRLFMAAGPLVAGFGFLLMLRVGTQVHYWSELFPGIVFFALGLSATVAPLTTAVLSDVDTKHAGIASAVNNAISRIAGLIMIALVGVVIGDKLNVNGFHRILIITVGLMAAGGLISAAGIRNASKATRNAAT